MFRHFVAREFRTAAFAQEGFLRRRRLAHEGQGLAEHGIGYAREEEGTGQRALQAGFKLFHLMLEAAGADDVVAAPEDEEGGGVGAELRDVVSGEAVGADVGRGDDKAVALVGLEGDTREGGVALAAMGTADAAQGDVGEGFGHAVGAPHVVWEIGQRALELGTDGAAADDEVVDTAQEGGFARALECLTDLEGGERGKDGGGVELGKGAPRWAHGEEAQMADEAAHDHHFPCDVLQGEAEKGGVAGLQAEEAARFLRTGAHVGFQDAEGVRGACGAGGVDGQEGRGAVPFALELLYLAGKGTLRKGEVVEYARLDDEAGGGVVLEIELACSEAVGGGKMGGIFWGVFAPYFFGGVGGELRDSVEPDV